MTRTFAALLAAALLVGACSSDEPAKPAGEASQTPTSTSPTPTPTPTLPSLLAGRMGKPNGPLLAVKFDNTAKAHPQLGLSVADVVYIEQVEGGVTRIAAVYSSQLPKRVGPVRSARITDIELLRQYGTVGLAYSGAQGKLHPFLRRARLKLVSNDASHRGYNRANDRPAPYDVIGDVSTLMKRAGKVSVPKRVGYTFGPAPVGGKPAKWVLARFPMARVGAQWSPKRKQWLIAMDGRNAMAAEGGQLGASTFIVQFSKITGSLFKDINGVVTPRTVTLGKGRAMIFRDGQVYEGQWSRAKASQPTTYTINGQPAVFAPGTLWVTLLGRGRPVQVG